MRTLRAIFMFITGISLITACAPLGPAMPPEITPAVLPSASWPPTTQPSYPYPAPQRTNIFPTSSFSDAKSTAQVATQVAQQTASAPTPGGSVISDPSGQFTIRLLPGWYALQGSTITIVNYYDEQNLGSDGNYPIGGLKVQIGVGKFAPGQNFDQWLTDWITISTAPPPDTDLPTLTVTAHQPYKLGPYNGITYFINSEPKVMEIILPQDSEVVVIGLTPANSSALAEAITMLSSIQIISETQP